MGKEEATARLRTQEKEAKPGRAEEESYFDFINVLGSVPIPSPLLQRSVFAQFPNRVCVSQFINVDVGVRGRRIIRPDINH